MSSTQSVDPAELRAWIELENLSSEDLDELVYDLAGEDAASAANQDSEERAEGTISAGERRAAAINNGGFDEQVPFIAAQFPTLSEAKRAVMDAQ